MARQGARRALKGIPQTFIDKLEEDAQEQHLTLYDSHTGHIEPYEYEFIREMWDDLNAHDKAGYKLEANFGTELNTRQKQQMRSRLL